jgi:hypothetical protein
MFAQLSAAAAAVNPDSYVHTAVSTAKPDVGWGLATAHRLGRFSRI